MRYTENELYPFLVDYIGTLYFRDNYSVKQIQANLKGVYDINITCKEIQYIIDNM